jgi:hypothetical protein
MNDDKNLHGYTMEQVSGIYAKLETARILINLGTDMAKQAETDLKFFRMANGLESDN